MQEMARTRGRIALATRAVREHVHNQYSRGVVRRAHRRLQRRACLRRSRIEQQPVSGHPVNAGHGLTAPGTVDQQVAKLDEQPLPGGRHTNVDRTAAGRQERQGLQGLALRADHQCQPPARRPTRRSPAPERRLTRRRREDAHVDVRDLQAARGEVVERALGVDRVVEDDGVDDQAERAELFF